MKKPEIDRGKIVILSGAGVSAPSGLATFRSSGGLWEQHRIEDVATPEGWSANPQLVLDFYNERRVAASEALPNDAHKAIAALERNFRVVVITQNVDDLHERAGSTEVIHLHGELTKARSSVNGSLIYDIGKSSIRIGDVGGDGSQLRPHIVWFGEEVLRFEEAQAHVLEAGRILVVGTSLAVFPAAGLATHARYGAEKVLVDLDPPPAPFGFRVLRGAAEIIVPDLVRLWNESKSNVDPT
jgi:NAD-dependent deacetylase